jgi:hypothetical protein
MKNQLNEIKRMQVLAGIITENQEVKEIKIKKSEVLPNVIRITEQAFKEGNKSDIKALEEKIGEELDIKTQYGIYFDLDSDSSLNGMKYIMVGSAINTICVVNLVDKPEYIEELNKEDSEYTKIGNWWIRPW